MKARTPHRSIFHVWEPDDRADYRRDIHVIKGFQEDLVLDAGSGLGSLRAFLTPAASSTRLIRHSDSPADIRRPRDFPVCQATARSPAVTAFRQVIDAYLASTQGKND